MTERTVRAAYPAKTRFAAVAAPSQAPGPPDAVRLLQPIT
jgi:hypothetical protein